MTRILGTAILAAAAGSAAASGQGEATTAEFVLPAPSRLPATPLREPSGVAFHPLRRTLFAVGDEGLVAEFDLSGTCLHTLPARGDLEDVAVRPTGGEILLLDEKKSRLHLCDPDSGADRRRWTLDRAGLLGQAPGPKNRGFEGVAVRLDPDHPGRDLLYLAHQRAPAMVVVVALDLSDPADRLEAASVHARWTWPDCPDLSAISYSNSLERFLLLSDADNSLRVVRPDGTIEGRCRLPKGNHEGACLDESGRLWVADDRQGLLLRFDGALEAIRTVLGSHPRKG